MSASPSRSGYTTMNGARTTSMMGACSQSGWVPTGNMVGIDQNELKELERMIMALTEQAEAAEARVVQLHQIKVRDALEFCIKNSDAANATMESL